MTGSKHEVSENQNSGWVSIIKKYNRPEPKKSAWQLVSTLVLYILSWILMYFSMGISYWITVALIFPAAGLLVRLFIIFHDCGHGSFFNSRWLNTATGYLIGILSFTPYHEWHSKHRIHHDTAGNLDKRGVGDVWTLTVEEWAGMTRCEKTQYWLYRHPVTMIGVGAFFMFVIANRFPKKTSGRMDRWSVVITNLGLLALATGMSFLIGIKAFLLIQMPVMYVAAAAGLWLFYLQHQFESVVWYRQDQWDYQQVALKGSSFFKLPMIFQWFSGNIGFHHIHHLSPAIPNYNLSRCHYENELFRKIEPLTFRRSFGALKLRFWDEAKQQIV